MNGHMVLRYRGAACRPGYSSLHPVPLTSQVSPMAVRQGSSVVLLVTMVATVLIDHCVAGEVHCVCLRSSALVPTSE